MEKFKVELKKSAVKELNAIPKKELHKILNRIQSLALNPRPQGCVKLTNREDYRIRVGNYRIIYSINDAVLVILIIKIGHRKEINR